MSDLLKLETRSLARQPVLWAKGEVDISNCDELTRAGLKAFADTAGPAIVDLTEVTYIDSTGVNALFALARRLTVANRQLHLVIPANSRLHRLVSLTGLDRVSTIFETLEASVGSDPDA